MKIKNLMLAMAAASALFASAQTQGYKDGIEYFLIDQFDDAKEILTKTMPKSGAERSEALYYLGAIELKDGNVKAAQQAFDEGISLNSKNGYNYVGLGAIALKQGDAKTAAEKFKLALKAQNKSFINVAIARAYYNQDPIAYAKEYEKHMDAARKQNLKDPSIYIMNGDFFRDKALASGVDDGTSIGNAASEYEQAVHFDNNSPVATIKYARVFVHVNPDYAISRLKELNEKVPNSAMAQRELAERYYDNDQWSLSARQYGKYIENPNHFAKDEERYAVLLFFGGRYDDSLELAHNILKKNPNSAQMRRMLFLNLEKKGDFKGAREAAESFFQTPGVSFTANDYTTYANILNELEDYDAEVIAREKAVEANVEKLELLKDLATAYSQAGGRANKANDIETANAYYIKAKDATQKFIDGGSFVTQDLVNLGNRWQNVAATSPLDSPEREAAINAAIAAADQVIERMADSPSYVPFRNKARMTLVKNGNKPSQETVDAYTKALEILDADPEAKDKRVDVYREAYSQIAAYYIGEHDTASAKVWYLKMLELDPQNQALRDYIDKLK